jgi:hypothetical protein
VDTHDPEPPAHDSVDEIDFVPPRDALARTRVTRGMEPGLLRSLGVAMVTGTLLGAAIFYFKPEPRGARANPIQSPPVRIAPAPIEPQKVELFELPAWDEAAHQRVLQVPPER